MNRRPVRLTRLGGAILILAPLAVAFAGPLKATIARPASPHGKFRGECADCHSASAWKPAKIGPKFDHAKFGFALEGAHAAADCRSCHASLDFTQERQLCVSCHEDVHRGEFGTECARCHTARSFIDRGTMLRRHQTSRFPLTGSHAALECEDCHRPTAAGHLQFVGKQADCGGCHLADYQAAKSPDHAGGSFPLDCMTCHTTIGWQGARFNHDRTSFPLTGAHRTAACASCHPGNVYQGTNTACASCHQADYDRTTDPAHAALGFSTQCATCHNTATWQGATFAAHDPQYFPIYSGAHQGRWANCATCHNSVNDYAQFTCFSCHPHDDKAGTDSHHTGVSGYSYTSQACYSCHPRGRK
jgi:hypothetical protein